LATKLRAPQARAIAEAEAKYARAKRDLEVAKVERDVVRARYAERLPLGQVVEAGGYVLKRIRKSTGKRFRLSAFLERHKLTKAMEPFVSEREYEDWQVRPAG
jgi:hypothetical protein